MRRWTEARPIDLSRYTVTQTVLVGGEHWPQICAAQKAGTLSVKPVGVSQAQVVITAAGALRLAKAATE